MRNLPRDIRPPVISKTDNDQAPVITIALSGDRSIRELTELADKTVRPVLERSTGVGEVRLVGGLLRSVNVVGGRRSAGRPTRSRSPRCATRSSARTPTCRAAT